MENKYEDIFFAKLDIGRMERTGIPETIFCTGKTNEQLLNILERFKQKNISVLGTRCSKEQYIFLKNQNKFNINYDEISKTFVLLDGEKMSGFYGSIAICTAGTSDIPVAEEAYKVLEFFGVNVNRFYDIGVAGLHRLLSKIDDIKKSDVIIAAAGMEGALASVIAGLVNVPVIGLPTSIGYGTSFNGLTSLLAMLNSCSEGISVVNIDNGFGAAVQAYRILKLKGKK